MEFMSPSGDRKSWLLHIESPGPGAARAAGLRDDEPGDRSRDLHHVVSHVLRPKGLRWGKDLEANFTSARALEAYYGGQQRLASYQRTFQAWTSTRPKKSFGY